MSAIKPGSEAFRDPEKVAYDGYEFRIRYSSEVNNLSPQDRVIYPALTAAQLADPDYVIPTIWIHDILGVSEIGRREGLRITAQRRSDVV